MNMGDFAGSEVPNLESGGVSFDLFGELSEEEKAQVNSLLTNEQIQDGLQLLTGKLPGFSSFYDALYPAESTSTQETTTEQVSDPKSLFTKTVISLDWRLTKILLEMLQAGDEGWLTKKILQRGKAVQKREVLVFRGYGVSRITSKEKF